MKFQVLKNFSWIKFQNKVEWFLHSSFTQLFDLFTAYMYSIFTEYLQHTLTGQNSAFLISNNSFSNHEINQTKCLSHSIQLDFWNLLGYLPVIKAKWNVTAYSRVTPQIESLFSRYFSACSDIGLETSTISICWYNVGKDPQKVPVEPPNVNYVT